MQKDFVEVDLKIVLAGESNVGKTTLCRKFQRGDNSGPIGPTLGIEYHLKVVELKINEKNYKVKTRIWDTAGQERYRAVTGVQLRNADGALVVYDLTHRETFNKVSEWLSDLPNLTQTDTKVTLVGNKLDLVENNSNARVVNKEEAELVAQNYDVMFTEASAIGPQE